MANPTRSPSPYQPMKRPRKPPMSAPTIPRRDVMNKPPGSRRRVRSLATMPATRPRKIQPKIYIGFSPLPRRPDLPSEIADDREHDDYHASSRVPPRRAP